MGRGTIESFWDQAHKNNSMEDLSGSKYEDTIDSLRLQEYIKQGTRVLEVGVGFGHAVEGLSKQGAVVSALDISEVALERVRKRCEFLFDINNLEQIPTDYFNVIICVNVAQHIPTDVLKKELVCLINSLTSDGVLALQFISYKDIEDDWEEDYKYEPNSSPSFRRSVNCMINIVAEVGGICEVVVDDQCDLLEVSGCHVLHIRRIK